MTFITLSHYTKTKKKICSKIIECKMINKLFLIQKLKIPEPF